MDGEGGGMPQVGGRQAGGLPAKSFWSSWKFRNDLEPPKQDVSDPGWFRPNQIRLGPDIPESKLSRILLACTPLVSTNSAQLPKCLLNGIISTGFQFSSGLNSQCWFDLQSPKGWDSQYLKDHLQLYQPAWAPSSFVGSHLIYRILGGRHFTAAAPRLWTWVLQAIKLQAVYFDLPEKRMGGKHLYSNRPGVPNLSDSVGTFGIATWHGECSHKMVATKQPPQEAKRATK